ncbi:probable palmitoyltransferase ZDHHC24 [Cydia strobilella]|uniref:probable palmitoyltransferase ZDHHC24 n=1 Tax=Cydia strobilella TaxID=1100964 RepID=UPI0030045B00
MSLPRTKKMKNLEITFEKIICFLIAFGTPVLFAFHMLVIRPKLLQFWDLSFTRLSFHALLCTYSFVNVFVNMIMILIVDSSANSYKHEDERWRYCQRCEKYQPDNSWHCKTCNDCILDRDHHCFCFNHCIGRNNLRYFICFLTHMEISLALCIYYDCCCITSEFNFNSFLDITSCVAEIIRPSYFMRKHLYAILWYFFVVIFILCGRLLWYHLDNVWKGMTSYEYHSGRIPKTTYWKKNMKRVFGVRWYLAILWPFVDSPLFKLYKIR